MLSSINPLGERARNQVFGRTVAWYWLGSALGGVAIGSVSGLVGSWLPDGPWRAVAAMLVALVGAALDLTGRRPPSVRRQVDENWLGRYRGWLYGVGFGLQLGMGVVTIVTTAAVYTTVALSVLLGAPTMGAVIGLTFGTVRGLAILRVAKVQSPGALRGAMRALQSGLPAATVIVVVAQLAASVGIAVVLIS